jgi:hypothetical protein
MEEDANVDLEYSILGSIKQPYPKTPFLLTYKIAKSRAILHDVVYANDSFNAHLALVSKTRLRDVEVHITNTLDLTKLIDEYYE